MATASEEFGNFENLPPVTITIKKPADP